MFYPDLEKIIELSSSYNIIPVSMEVYADLETPITLLRRFEDNEYCFLLESVQGGERWARYSFIGRNPFITLESRNTMTVIRDKEGNITEKKGNPVTILEDLITKYKAPDLPGMPRFNGGAVGFFGYDIARHSENLPNIPRDTLELPDCQFLFTDEVIAFDHLKQKIHIIVNLHTDRNIHREYTSCVERIKDIYREISNTRWKVETGIKPSSKKPSESFKYASNITKDHFCSNVEKAKQYIRNGDIFQVVLSQRLCVKTTQKPMDVYRVLRVINPSPYMYYLKFGEYVIAGASPELLVRVEGGFAETCPIAGTRKRGMSVEEDEMLEKELINDEKERAEHTMLVDLGRNDIGRVSKFGSVKVENFMHIEKYSHVMHLVTNIKGEMRKGKTPFDALMAVLPAGTLSGAPKIRAMEIIDELETVKRGLYGGAIGYLSFNGNLDSCITIRTIVFKDKKAYVQAGGGIVADSIPELEYEETLSKARALLNALEKAGKIL